MQRIISIKVKYELKNAAAVVEFPLRISVRELTDTKRTPEIKIRVEGNQMEEKLLFICLDFQF